MSALAIADLHLNSKNRDGYRHLFMRNFPKLVQKHKPDWTIILGDLTDEKDKHDAWLVNRIVDYIAELRELSRVIVLRGNHDYIDVEDPFFQFLSHLDRVSFISRPTLVKLDDMGQCMFLPHARNYQREWGDAVYEKKFNWIFAHNTFEGASAGHGRRLDGIPTKTLGSNRVISGDVHVPQSFENITYVGAPYTINFGDDYKPRVLLIDKKIESVAVAGPQKRLVNIHRAKDFRIFNSFNEWDIVKVCIHIGVGESDKLQTLTDDAIAWAKGAHVHLHSVQAVIDGQEYAAGGKVMPDIKQEMRTDKEIVSDFASKRHVDDRTLKTGLFLMDKSKK